MAQEGLSGLNITWAGQLFRAQMKREGTVLPLLCLDFLCQVLGVASLPGPRVRRMWPTTLSLVSATMSGPGSPQTLLTFVWIWIFFF